MATTIPSAALVPAAPVFTNTERLALAGFLAEKKIDPLVTHTFALLEARQAIELLATGSVEGKIVLMNS